MLISLKRSPYLSLSLLYPFYFLISTRYPSFLSFFEISGDLSFARFLFSFLSLDSRCFSAVSQPVPNLLSSPPQPFLGSIEGSVQSLFIHCVCPIDTQIHHVFLSLTCLGYLCFRFQMGYINAIMVN